MNANHVIRNIKARLDVSISGYIVIFICKRIRFYNVWSISAWKQIILLSWYFNTSWNKAVFIIIIINTNFHHQHQHHCHHQHHHHHHWGSLLNSRRFYLLYQNICINRCMTAIQLSYQLTMICWTACLDISTLYEMDYCLGCWWQWCHYWWPLIFLHSHPYPCGNGKVGLTAVSCSHIIAW